MSLMAGCSLIKTGPAYADDDVIATLYGENITYGDLKSVYSNYSYYVSYGLEESLVMRLVYDELYTNAFAKHNAKEIIVLSEEDADEIWETVFHSYLELINGYEEAILKAKGVAIPERISEHKDNDSKETSSNVVYEEYSFEPVRPVDYSSVTAAVAPDYAERVVALHDELFEDVTEEYLTYRNQAWDKMVGNLVYSYKMQGTTLSKNAALIKSLTEAYEAEYESVLLEKYEEYVNSLVFGNYNLTDNEAQLAAQLADSAVKKKIVEKYKQMLSASKQKGASKEDYTSILYTPTSSQNVPASKDYILYHYYDDELNATNVAFFSVMHILVEFDSDAKAALNELIGSTSTKDYIFWEEYNAAREAYAKTGSDWTISTTYRDENGEVVTEDLYEDGEPVYETDENGDFVYETDDEGNIVYITDEFGEYVLDGDSNPQPKKVVKQVAKTITLQEIYEAFNAELDAIKADTSLTSAEKTYASTSLFRKYMYLYTSPNEYSNLNADTLTNLIGYAMSTEDGENANLMKEFADEGKVLYNTFVSNSGSFIGDTVGFAITSYGVHMMILTNVFEPGEVVSVTVDDGAGNMIDRSEDDIIADLESVIVTNYKSQTLLEYIYEQTKTSELENFYDKYINQALADAKNSGDFVEKVHPSYDVLSSN